MTNKGSLSNLSTQRFIFKPSESHGQCSLDDIGPPARSTACTASERTASNCTSQAENSLSADNQKSRPAEGPHRQLNRATDAFVYAGSSIDVKSYGLFSHYASECEYRFPNYFLMDPLPMTSFMIIHVIHCEDIQPLPFAKQTICCSAAVQENCTALLYAICFTAATHDVAISVPRP